MEAQDPFLLYHQQHQQQQKKKEEEAWPSEEERVMANCPSLRRVLLVEEAGNLFFSKPLANAVASLDAQEQLLREDGLATASNVQSLRPRGFVLIYSMDASRMAEHVQIGSGLTFDRVLYNLPPCAGLSKMEVAEEQIRLLKPFLANASKLLSSDGEVHVYQVKTKRKMVKKRVARTGLMLKPASACNSCHVPGYPSIKFVFVLDPSLSEDRTGLSKHTTGQAVLQKKLRIKCKEAPAATDGLAVIREPFSQEGKQLCEHCKLPLGIGVPLDIGIPVVNQTNVAQQHVHNHDLERVKAHPQQYPHCWTDDPQVCTAANAKRMPPNAGGWESHYPHWWTDDPRVCTAANAKRMPPSAGVWERQYPHWWTNDSQAGTAANAKRMPPNAGGWERQEYMSVYPRVCIAANAKRMAPSAGGWERQYPRWWTDDPQDCIAANAKRMPPNARGWERQEYMPMYPHGKRPCLREIESNWWRKGPQECPEAANVMRQPLHPLDSNAMGIEEKQQSEGKRLIKANAGGGGKEQTRERGMPVQQWEVRRRRKRRRRRRCIIDGKLQKWNGRGKGNVLKAY